MVVVCLQSFSQIINMIKKIIARSFVCVFKVCVRGGYHAPMEATRVCHFSSQLDLDDWTTAWVLGTEHRSSGRAASAVTLQLFIYILCNVLLFTTFWFSFFSIYLSNTLKYINFMVCTDLILCCCHLSLFF